MDQFIEKIFDRLLALAVSHESLVGLVKSNSTRIENLENQSRTEANDKIIDDRTRGDHRHLFFSNIAGNFVSAILGAAFAYLIARLTSGTH